MAGSTIFDDPDFARFLNERLDEIEAIVIMMLVEHMRIKPPGELDPPYAAINAWLGDDWHIDLSDTDQRVVGKHEGWFHPDWVLDDPELRAELEAKGVLQDVLDELREIEEWKATRK